MAQTSRKLTVTSQKELATWNKDGEDVTIYEVQAVNEHGQVVDQKLRTFQADLPQGELIDFQVSPYEHKEHGLSYTLKMPTKGRASKKDIGELKTQVADLAGRVSALEVAVEGLGKSGQPSSPSYSSADDDIPF